MRTAVEFGLLQIVIWALPEQVSAGTMAGDALGQRRQHIVCRHALRLFSEIRDLIPQLGDAFRNVPAELHAEDPKDAYSKGDKESLYRKEAPCSGTCQPESFHLAPCRRAAGWRVSLLVSLVVGGSSGGRRAVKDGRLCIIALRSEAFGDANEGGLRINNERLRKMKHGII